MISLRNRETTRSYSIEECSRKREDSLLKLISSRLSTMGSRCSIKAIVISTS